MLTHDIWGYFSKETFKKYVEGIEKVEIDGPSQKLVRELFGQGHKTSSGF